MTCAVSGGADSLALLVLAVDAGCEVTAIHVDHALRPGSAADADVVATVAHTWGAQFKSVRAPVTPGPNLEARAREARYGVLPPDVLTGHTADDQAETVVLNLLRGAGLAGLAGMRREHRPLLSLRRWETRWLCTQLGLSPVEDETNADLRFRRNQIRHEVMPALDDVAARDVGALLARQADLLRDDADLLDALALELDPTDARALRGAPTPLAPPSRAPVARQRPSPRRRHSRTGPRCRPRRGDRHRDRRWAKGRASPAAPAAGR